MPTFQRAHLISEAIQSVLEQTYQRWELLVCDDGSTDDTQAVIREIQDSRIAYHPLSHGGAARARNYGLRHALGQYIAYLDTDNLWHPDFLLKVVNTLAALPGKLCAYSDFFDVEAQSDGSYSIYSSAERTFCYERLSRKNFIDLNTFVHRSVLFDNFGGFDESLSRQQDWDLILKYTFLQSPVYVNQRLVLYRRNSAWQQITTLRKADTPITQARIQQAVHRYHTHGLPDASWIQRRSVTVLSWDVCRNHFSKAYNIAEALSERYDVQLLGFRFFEGEIFPPYRGSKPPFELTVLPGGQFPGFSTSLSQALNAIRGDVIYAVKPRLPSMGLALLANAERRIPIVVEFNDLESVVTNPTGVSSIQGKGGFFWPWDKDLLNPYGQSWTLLMERLAHHLPFTTTHNANLDAYFGGRSAFVRNLKDERYFDPERYNRAEIRARLGYSPSDRVILFGGMLRRHKGILELVDLLEKLNDERYKLLFVSSRKNADEALLREHAGANARIQVLDSVDRNAMAEINLAADVVILWLDPAVRASHYQMPYKLTDALAMGVPVIANPVSDLKRLGRQGYLQLVDFGDYSRLTHQLRAMFQDGQAIGHQRDAARRLYLREFSYKSVARRLELVLQASIEVGEPLRVARKFSALLRRLERVSGQRSMLRGASRGLPQLSLGKEP